MSYPLTEKTLELNVLKNMLEDIQGNISRTAYLYGFSLKHESTTGLDATIRVRGNPLMLALQFKKAVKKRGSVYTFRFNNNTYYDQHNMLYLSAWSTRPVSSVFYALPAYADINELTRSSPNFHINTYLLDPLYVGPINDWRTHYIIADVSSRTCVIRSEFRNKPIKLYSWKEIVEGIQTEKFGIRTSAFLDNIRVSLREWKQDIFIYREKPRRTYMRSLIMPI